MHTGSLMISPGHHSNRRESNDHGPSLEETIREQLHSAGEAVNLRQFDKARALISSAIHNADTKLHSTHQLRIETREVKALLADELGNTHQAVEILDEAIQIIAATPNSSRQDLSRLQIQKAELYCKLHCYDEAQSVWQSMISDRDTPVADRCYALLGIARSYRSAGDAQSHATYTKLALAQANLVATPVLRHNTGHALLQGAQIEASAGQFHDASRLSAEGLKLLVLSGLISFEERNAAALVVSSHLERAGLFTKALTIREKILSSLKKKYGATSSKALSLQHSVALTTLDQGNFEKAELLLQTIWDNALSNNDPEQALSAALSLSGAYREQGLFKEATTILTDTEELISHNLNPAKTIELLEAKAICFGIRGATKRAEKNFDLALEQAEQLPDFHRLWYKTTIHACRASIFAARDIQKARDSLQFIYKNLNHIPPGHEPLSNHDLQLLAALVQDDTDFSPVIALTLLECLEDHKRKHGETRSISAAELSLLIARHQKWEDRAEAQQTLEQAQQLLEKRARQSTPLYGTILTELCELLPIDDPKRTEFAATAERILSKLGDSTIEESELDDDLTDD